MTAELTEVTAATTTRARPLLEVTDFDVVLGHGWRASHVLNGVSLTVWPGEIVGLVGETGSGKTTLARTVVGLARPRGGRVVFDGREISRLRGAARRNQRRTGDIQLVFQDPLRSLDPDLTVGDIVGEGLKIRGLPAAEIGKRVVDALAKVGLTAALRHRQPGQISGGQRQRVSIARALAADPKLLLCDEPVSALDASNRNYILRLLAELRDSLGLPIVIISHDLSSLAGIADRVVVLYRGRIVEDGPVDQVFATPRHPYTALLMASAPRVERHSVERHGTERQGAEPDDELSVHQLRRTTADPEPPAGAGACVFAARCPFAIDACAVQPPLTPVAGAVIGPAVAGGPPGHWAAACHRQNAWRALARERPPAARR
jgi:oligopeptide/dipeptide ABC transporter ATP-binding protein